MLDFEAQHHQPAGMPLDLPLSVFRGVIPCGVFTRARLPIMRIPHRPPPSPGDDQKIDDHTDQQAHDDRNRHKLVDKPVRQCFRAGILFLCPLDNLIVYIGKVAYKGYPIVAVTKVFDDHVKRQ